MGDPHNTARYGELWSQRRIDLCLEEMEFLRPHVVFSGGWAWHFMSAPGHPEYKHAHDHKDIDLFCNPEEAESWRVIPGLKTRGFERVWTKYDKLPSEEEFRRYEKTVEGDSPVRITIDFFFKKVPEILLYDKWRVVDPATLVTYYSSIHSSKSCFAVQAATKLLAKGVDPVGHPDLVTIPKMN